MDTRKEAILEALERWINRRPGLEFANYGDAASYRSEQRSIARDKREALTLLAAVRWRDSITADALLEASRHAFSGRLTIKFVPAGKTVRGVFIPSPVPDAPECVRIDYCTGQYWPTEYRRAVCAVLAGALWDWMRDGCMPTARGDGTYELRTNGKVSAVSAGEWLRRTFSREFGKSLAARWFN